MRKLIAAGVIIALLATTSAIAKDMDCQLNEDYVDTLDGKSINVSGTTYQLTVKHTFSGIPESVSTNDYNSFVTVKFGTENTDSKEGLTFFMRPRKSSECLIAAYDDSKHLIWGGDGITYCHTNEYVKVPGELTLRATDDAHIVYAAAGDANTISKHNMFLGLYARDDTRYLLIGACAEDK